MRLPAGSYFIGDPCYAIPDKDWGDVLDATCFFGLYEDEKAMTGDGDYQDKEDQGGVFEWKGFKIAAHSTAYGDGVYASNIGTGFSVDAGLIGAVPGALVSEAIELGETTLEQLDRLGKMVTFDKPVRISYSEGTIKIGDIEIYTGDEEEDDEDDPWGEGYEEDEVWG